LKIAIFGPAYPFRGGIAQFSGVLAQALRAGGHEVTLVNFKKQFPKFLFPGTTQFDDSPTALKPESLRTFTLWNPLTWWRTARAIRDTNPDLILVAWWMPFFGAGYWAVAKLLGRAYRQRICYLLHNVIPHERRPGDLFFSKLALNSATSYLALSRAEERALKRHFPVVPAARIHYSPHPIYDNYVIFSGTQDEARAALGIRAERLLLFFGFIREYKGLDTLIRALPEILESYPDTQLAIVGEFYQDRQIYDQLIDALLVREAVIIHEGYVSGDDVGRWFAAADVVVLPYKSATQSGIVPIAYALNMPVITTNVGGLPEVVSEGKTGFTVPPEDPHALAQAVEKYFATGGRPVFEKHVTEEALNFSWEAMVAKLQTIVDELK
jgi:glycosyltransferase involved in cell wall biosynthesis